MSALCTFKLQFPVDLLPSRQEQKKESILDVGLNVHFLLMSTRFALQGGTRLS